MPTVPYLTKIPIAFVEFLATDFCKYKTDLERIDHLSFYAGIKEIREYSLYWLDVLNRKSVMLFGMRRPRVAVSTLIAIQYHLGSFDCIYGNANYPHKLTAPVPAFNAPSNCSIDIT